MDSITSIFLTVLRMVMGGIFLITGLGLFNTPNWSPAPLFNSAHIFSNFFNWFALSANVHWVSLVIMWGLCIIGVCLILGLATRLASLLAMIGLVFYYLMTITIVQNSFLASLPTIINATLVFVLVSALLYRSEAGSKWSLDRKMPVQL